MKIGAFIIPTGVGASIGGYAGDASYWARKLAEKYKLIVNPNVVNAACFSGITDNMLYVEGYSLDEFFKGNLSLKEVKGNKLGVVFDKSIKKEVLNIHINTINAVKTVYGVNVIGYEITKENVGVEFFIDKYGNSTGNVNNLTTIKDAAQTLISKGAEAIAIVCRFPEDINSDYEKGVGVDPVGGVEAIISHFISKELKIPCAHAPAFDDYSINTEIVSPKCAAEYITPTFLPCVLLGLNNAPRIVEYNKNFISIEDIEFLIIPHNSVGSVPVLKMLSKGKEVYCIKENSTILNVNKDNFNIKCDTIDKYEELLERL